LCAMEQPIYYAVQKTYDIPILTEPFGVYDEDGNWHRRYEPHRRHEPPRIHMPQRDHFYFYDSLCEIYIRVGPCDFSVESVYEDSEHMRIPTEDSGTQYKVEDSRAEKTIIANVNKEQTDQIQYYNILVLTAPYEIFDSFGRFYSRYEPVEGSPRHFFDHLARIFIRVCPGLLNRNKATQCCEEDFQKPKPKPKPEPIKWADVKEDDEDKPVSGWGKVSRGERPGLSEREWPSLSG